MFSTNLFFVKNANQGLDRFLRFFASYAPTLIKSW